MVVNFIRTCLCLSSVSSSVKREKRPPSPDDDDDVIILSDNDSSPSPPMNGLSHFRELDTDLLMVRAAYTRTHISNIMTKVDGMLLEVVSVIFVLVTYF